MTDNNDMQKKNIKAGKSGTCVAEEILRLRKEIDAIDDLLLDMLEKRAKCSLEIGRVKARQGRDIESPEREKDLLNRLLKKAVLLPEEHLRAIYAAIFRSSRALQKDLQKEMGRYPKNVPDRQEV